MDAFLPLQWCCQSHEELSEVVPAKEVCVVEGYTAG